MPNINNECGITLDEVKELIGDDSMYCEYCMCEVYLIYLKHSGDQFTLERIDNNYGHSKTNVVISCWKCNEMRGAKYEYTGFRQAMREKVNGNNKLMNKLVRNYYINYYSN